MSEPHYESAAVPFVKIGNRRGLTDKQIAENPYLADFVQQFPRSFERDEIRRVSLFIEPEIEPAYQR